MKIPYSGNINKQDRSYQVKILRLYILSMMTAILLFLLTFIILQLHSLSSQYNHQMNVLRAETYEHKKRYISEIILTTIQGIETDKKIYRDELRILQYNMEQQGITISLEEMYDMKILKERAAQRIRNTKLVDNGYIWVNEIINYEGGEDYAIRKVHPNLLQTEGIYLSTETSDEVGNKPYKVELEGIKKDGELFFSYWFKKKDSPLVSEKLTFAKLYKEFNWIIATGVYLDDIEKLIESEGIFLKKTIRKEMVMLFLISLFIGLIGLTVTLLLNNRLRDILFFYERSVKNREQILEDLVEERTEKFKKAKAEYQDLYDNSPDMYFSASASTHVITMCNKMIQNILHSSDSIVGKSFYSLFHESSRKQLETALELFKETGHVENIELSLLLSSQLTIPVIMNIRSQNGGIKVFDQFQATLRDIRELTIINEEKVHLERKLQQSQKLEALGTMSGGIAHDFNNLLVPILGYAELGAESADIPEQYSRYFSWIKDSAQKAAKLTKQILVYSRQQVFEQRVLDLNQLLKNFHQTALQYLPPQKKLEYQLEAEIPHITADKEQLEQVLLNMILNSEDAILKEGTILISSSQIQLEEGDPLIESLQLSSGRYVTLCIHDTGRGIKPENIQKIFDPFYSNKNHNKGTGLGLAICYGIIQKHNGSIAVDSILGKGTTICIYLPGTEKKQKIQKERKKTPLQKSDLFQTKTILIVDDEKGIVEMLSELLGNQGFNVLKTESTEEGLHMARQNKDIDLLISDITMPDLNGQEFYALVKEIIPGIKVLFISGYTHSILKDNSMPFIQKPFQPDNLLLMVESILDL